MSFAAYALLALLSQDAPAAPPAPVMPVPAMPAPEELQFDVFYSTGKVVREREFGILVDGVASLHHFETPVLAQTRFYDFDGDGSIDIASYRLNDRIYALGIRPDSPQYDTITCVLEGRISRIPPREVPLLPRI